MTNNCPAKVVKRIGPLITKPGIFDDTKDPCPVFDGKLWHIYGSGGASGIETWQVLHATSVSIEGPWKLEEPLKLKVKGNCVAAPGVVYDQNEQMFHMFIQTTCWDLGGTVEHLVSSDGYTFNNLGTVLSSIPDSDESGIYDPHPAKIGGEYYFVYSGVKQVAHPDIYLAKSTGISWYGPWERVGKILSHSQVPFHNQLDSKNYEWGLEGAQLIELPNGKILLNAVCFLSSGEPGTRQRVFFATSDQAEGPYTPLGTVLEPLDKGWGEGENGHATAIILNNKLELMYQARYADSNWRYGLAEIDINSLTT